MHPCRCYSVSYSKVQGMCMYSKGCKELGFFPVWWFQQPFSLHHSYLMSHHNTANDNQQLMHSYTAAHLWWKTPCSQHQSCSWLRPMKSSCSVRCGSTQQILIVNCSLFEQSVHSSARVLKQWPPAIIWRKLCSAISCKHSFTILGEVYLFVFLLNHESITVNTSIEAADWDCHQTHCHFPQR